MHIYIYIYLKHIKLITLQQKNTSNHFSYGSDVLQYYTCRIKSNLCITNIMIILYYNIIQYNYE